MTHCNALVHSLVNYPAITRALGSSVRSKRMKAPPKNMLDLVAANAIALAEFRGVENSGNAAEYVPNVSALAKRAGNPKLQPSFQRLIKRGKSSTLRTIVAMAKALDVPAWHLLLPGYDPRRPLLIAETQEERRLLRSYRGMVNGPDDGEAEVKTVEVSARRGAAADSKVSATGTAGAVAKNRRSKTT